MPFGSLRLRSGQALRRYSGQAAQGRPFGFALRLRSGQAQAKRWQDDPGVPDEDAQDPDGLGDPDEMRAGGGGKTHAREDGLTGGSRKVLPASWSIASTRR